jgi:membrane protease YdiL (CAAX protease family)
LLQAGIASELTGEWAVPIAVAAAALIFGACHWLNREYAALATLIGVYLGMLFVVTGNLLAPITAHVLYDFVALWYLVIWKGKQVKPSAE